MIDLSNYDKMWIKMCKMHYKDKYPLTGKWAETIKPMFREIYGWDPDTDYETYLGVVFEKLFDVFWKIRKDCSGSNLQLKSLFSSAFYKSPGRDEDNPIERAIGTLCGLIQSNPVIEEMYGMEIERYIL